MTNSEIKRKSLETFKKDRWPAIGVCLVYGLLVPSNSYSSSNSDSSDYQGLFEKYPNLLTILISILAIVLVVRLVIAVFVEGPLLAGKTKYFMNASREEKSSFVNLFQGFNKKDYWRYVGANLLRGLYIFLWSLLFIIPGIIKSYAYSMQFYIMRDHPEMSASEALEESEKMMQGHKWELFCLGFSYIGWILLSILTLGILSIFYVDPWMHMADANFYNALIGYYREEKNFDLSGLEMNLDECKNEPHEDYKF